MQTKLIQFVRKKAITPFSVQVKWLSDPVHKLLLLLVPQIKKLSSFELGFLNIFSRQNLLRSSSLVLFLLQHYKYGAKKCPKTTFDSTSEMIRL